MSPAANPAAPAGFSRASAPARNARAPARLADPALTLAVRSWCVVAIAGQGMFAAYVVLFFGRAAVAGRPELWNKALIQGYVPGDTLGNLILALHLLFTVVVIVGGAIQLTPQVRRLAPAVHRWNGRLYLGSALVMGTGGLIMFWTRKTVGDAPQHAAITLNALLIVVFAVLAWRHALARRFDQHRRWALRLFLAVSGVWFFRIGLMAWVVLNRGPVGFDPKTFVGPFLTFLAFAQYLLPLAVLEIYFRVRDHAGPHGRLAMAAGLFALTLMTALGIGAASMIMWLPKM